ncbi:MAG TPA: hypothetical protein VK196_19645 [Magnetospirillum sp.]|nr:hypothetical protein [Magnetospirillum sp.]
MKSRKPFTFKQAATAKWLVIEHGYYQHEAAAVVGCNQGRVSEAMNGKRYPEAPPENMLNVTIH